MSTEERPVLVGRKLKELRLSKGLSLREAARRLGISYSRLSDFEGGLTHSTNRPAVPGPGLLARAGELYRYPAETLMALAGHSLAEAQNSYVPSAMDADVTEIASVYRRLPKTQQKLLLAIVREFDRAQ